MIIVYNVHYSVMEYANEKLADFIELYFDLIFNSGDDGEMLFSFFPEIVVLERKEKCYQTIKDLYYWSQDKYIHELTPIHEYAIYRIIEAHENLYQETEENIYNMINIEDVPIGDSEELTMQEIIDIDMLYADTFSFYYENLFLDHDFTYMDLLLNRYILGDEHVFESYGVDIRRYEDLIPMDITQKYKHLFEDTQDVKIVKDDTLFSSRQELKNFINELISHFNNALVNEDSSLLLWNDNLTPKKEKSVQSLFYKSITHECNQNKIDISREVNNGLGPVDFKFTYNHNFKILLEIKLLSSTKIYKGLEAQLLQYMIQENVNSAIYLVVVFYDNELKKVEKLTRIAKELNDEYSLEIEVQVVDARRTNLSASIMNKEDIRIYKKIE